ncbi:F-box/kelch-repeat protein SKIP25 [Dioscorea cayenensis subsp. rotundata]|uniref:F-box/kelch-repeat protein SKIP25 n=1 Tax=Dioscorea cayennensis subsp. rotundata TaxID=55577 RepID=A0AB40C464_DIOCR|nr:F-box/kelch-repeat protein SKIP25 [Dioscorea cayenensis subsp. rotundata]
MPEAPQLPSPSPSPSSQRAKRPKNSPPEIAGDVEEEGGGGVDQQALLPGLPDHLSQQCLSLLPPSFLFSVCRSWRRLLYSPCFPPFLSLYALLSHSNPSSFPSPDSKLDLDPIGFNAFDPISATWTPLPPPPPDALLRRLLLRHPSFIARNFPVQSVSAGDHLVVIAGTTDHLLPALSHPIAFHPSSGRWLLGPPFPSPRRWCVAGAASGAVYLASGVGSGYSTEIARSAERWDLRRRGAAWEAVASLRDSKFSREAVEAVASNGKLCMVNLRGRGPKYGAVYDIESDRWEEMPTGLLAGWTGPAAADDESGGPIFVADEASGELRCYSWEADTWRVVIKSELLKGAAQMACAGGKVCVASSVGDAAIVVDVRRSLGKIWTVDPPLGMRIMALHILPRMSWAQS